MVQSKEEFLLTLCKEINITLEKRQACQLLEYYDLLVEWNEKINLTSITEFEDVCLKHFIDSMSIVNLFDSSEEMINHFKGKTLIDVGTGAGFPGIVLKILIPGLHITLMDSLDKRIKFLNLVIEKLGLSDIETVHGRVEDFANKPEFREQFDYATARAVAALPVLSEYCIPFVKLGGSFISYKSEKADEEISISDKALSILGGKISSKISFTLPKSDLGRTLIVIEKEKATPKSYPRKAGTPSKKPL